MTRLVLEFRITCVTISDASFNASDKFFVFQEISLFSINYFPYLVGT